MKFTEKSLQFFSDMHEELDRQLTSLFNHKVKCGQAEGSMDFWIAEGGIFEIHSSSYCCGDKDTYTTYISFTELLNSEQTIREYEEAKKRQEEIQRQLEVKREADKAAEELAREKSEYLRLQKKFG